MKTEHFTKAFKTEWLKINGLGLITMSIAFAVLIPFLSLIIKIFKENPRIYDGIKTTVAKNEVLNGLNGYEGFFMLLFIIIAATRISQTDHKNNGWTFLETQPLSKLSIYSGKFFAVFALSVLGIILFLFSSIFFGSISQLLFPQENLSFSVEWGWLLHTFIRMVVMSLGIISLQMMLSVIIRGFIWPFMIGFVGFVINIVSKVRQETYDFVPYNNLDTSLVFKNSNELNHFFNYSDYLSLFWAVLFFVIGFLVYSRRGFKNAFFNNSKTVIKTLAGAAVFAALFFWLIKPVYPQKLNGITVVEGKINADKQPEFITLISQELREEVAKIPVKNGKFRWETTKDIPFSAYALDVDRRYVPLFLSKGDHIMLEISKDNKHFEVYQKGTRKAENLFSENQNDGYSSFYEFTVKEKKLTNDPEKFYKQAREEWTRNRNFLDNYRTKENIHFSEDFYTYKKQQYAVKMMDAIRDYQRITSFSDKKFAPPADFIKELQDVVKKPVNMLLTSDEYTAWKLKNLLPESGTKNPDSIIFAKIAAMPKGKDKDQLLKAQLLKNFDLIKDENSRNVLFAEKSTGFSNPKYAGFVANELKIINNQQKGKPFPTFVFEDESGKKVNLSQFKGKYVVIDFWATWCAPCKETSPVFEYQAKNYKYLDNIVFLAVSIDEDKNKWKLDIKNKKSDVNQWWMTSPNALKMLGVDRIPRFIMVDPQGKIYNANMPRPNETNFEDILDKVGETKSFTFEM